MAAALSIVMVFTVLLVGDAIRVQRVNQTHNSSVPYGAWQWTMVDNLYTFGAPMPTGYPAENAMDQNGCFKGYRVLREGGANANRVDMVVTLLTFNGFKHPKLPVYRVNSDRSAREHGCGWKYDDRTRLNQVALHDLDDYVSLTRSKLGPVASLGLALSYDQNMARVAQRARNAGWGLVDSIVVQGGWLWFKSDEVTHLFQNPNTLDCILTFEGTDNGANWADNLAFFKTSFCGLNTRVHRGFRNAMRLMTQSDAWKNRIKTKLPFCRKLSVTGHSLGGAISTLFSACANNKYFASGDSDNKDVTWTKQTPKRLSYK